MKSHKLTGFVLLMHIIITSLLFVQPGCNTQEPLPPQEPTFTARGFHKGEAAELDSFNPNINDLPVGRTFSGPLGDRPRLAPKRPQPPVETLVSSAVNQGEGWSLEPADSSYTTYSIQKGDTLSMIAKKFDVSLKELMQKNNLKKDTTLSIGKKLIIPSKNSIHSLNTEDGILQTAVTYKVMNGDSLSGIAHRYKTTIQAIKQANNLHSNVILVGQILKIPAEAQTQPVAIISGNQADQKNTSLNKTHTVQAGETLSDIALKYNTNAGELMRINSITDARKLRIGQALSLPSSTEMKEHSKPALPFKQGGVREVADEPVLITKSQSQQNATISYLKASEGLREEDSYLFDSDDAIPVVPVEVTK